MWRRTYVFCLLVRLLFALSPSYLHPDENFQGPEVIAGRIFSYPVLSTWEFTSAHPIRSSFPLWLVYGTPMLLLREIWEGFGWGEISPTVVYWTLRVLMFILSFVLQDWALHELIQSPTQRWTAMLLVASSYVTWTYQTHTFSNSIETLVVLWSIGVIKRMLQDKHRTGFRASAILSFLIVLGIFNRITFPAFLVVHGIQLLPLFWRKPLCFFWMLLFTAHFTIVAIALDTAFYTPGPFTLRTLYNNRVITPLNNLLYNTQTENLAKHGLHPFYQHFVGNLPLLIGPAIPLMLFCYRLTDRLLAAIVGVFLLSFFPHQEARFLLPAVPLILSSIQLPKILPRLWLAVWIIFNAILGLLMGAYHQGGVVPVQTYLANTNITATHVFWWKTYSPPVWLLNGKNEYLATNDLMGIKGDEMVKQVLQTAQCSPQTGGRSPDTQLSVYLVAPRSAKYLDQLKGLDREKPMHIEQVYAYKRHLNLDDLDWGEDGVWETLRRVVGRRGLTLWRVRPHCKSKGQA